MIADGRLIFSKAKVHRFPNDGEIEAIFEAIKQGKEPPSVEEARPTGFISRALNRLRN